MGRAPDVKSKAKQANRHQEFAEGRQPFWLAVCSALRRHWNSTAISEILQVIPPQ
jgi:hypothetical protein